MSRPTLPGRIRYRNWYGEQGIRVNGICPTYAKTALTRELFDDKDFDQAFTESIPLKRWGEVEDISNLAGSLPPTSRAISTGTSYA